MTGIEVRCGDGTIDEVRPDAGRSPRFAAAARPTGGFDARRNTQHAICRCSRRPKGQSFPRNVPESGECRFIAEGKSIMDPKVMHRKLPAFLENDTLGRPRRAILDRVKTSQTLSALTELPKARFDLRGRHLPPESLDASYYWITYPINPNAIVLVYAESYSNFNDTTQNFVFSYTSKYTNTYTMTFEGEVGANIDIFSFNFSFSYAATSTAEKDITVTATAGPNQWLTGSYGAWFEARYGCTSHYHDSDGTDTLLSSYFELWTPTGATGWWFDNAPP